MAKESRAKNKVAPVPVAAPVPPAPLRFFTRADWIAATITFLISGCLFLYYMSPSVTLEDSGELVTGAYNFGVPHPPGYPLWAFLGWVWRHLVPFGNPAWRICLMSVVTGALVVGALSLLMTRSILSLLRALAWADPIDERMKHWIALTVGAAVALLFGFNRGVWLWACVPEMRVLNVFMFILVACTFFAWMMRPQHNGLMYATLLVYGLGISNHQTIVVMAVPFMIGAFAVGWLGSDESGPVRMKRLSVFWELVVAALFALSCGALVDAWLLATPQSPLLAQRINSVILFGPVVPAQLLIFGPVIVAVVLLIVFGERGWLNRRRALICTATFLMGCSFYLYMPIAAATNPSMNWGYAATKQGFLHHITRGQYERLNLASPLSEAFFIQIYLFVRALLQQFSLRLGFEKDFWLGLPVVMCALLTLSPLIKGWHSLRAHGRTWLLFVWAAFLTTSLGLLTIINPGLDKQNQEINIKFFAPAHGFFAMLVGYGIAMTLALMLVSWKTWSRGVVRGICVVLLFLPLVSLQRNRSVCDLRGHDFGYQFGFRMFYPGDGYPPMDKDAVLYGGTDPGRFVPTYMIFCESRAKPADRFQDSHFDPTGGRNFDRRDVYIITQNALADNTYMSYIRDQYDYSRPDPRNPVTLENFPAWRRWLFEWAWKHLDRDTMYPPRPIYIPSDQDTQRAFSEYVQGLQHRQPGPDEQVEISGGQVQVKGVGGVMAINAILTKWIFERARDQHSFYVEESYVIPWMYPYLSPFGIIMKINHDPLPGPNENPALWQQIIARDTAYWNNLYKDFMARPVFRRDSDAQKTFSKLRSAIGGIYAFRGLIPQAEYAFKQARALCPDSPEANFRLAQLYMERNRLDDAIAVLTDLQKRDPLNSKITQTIQQLQAVKQGRAEAQQLEHTHTANPRDIGVVLQLAQTYFKIGAVDRIPPLCETFLAQTNLPAGDMMQIAQIYLSLRNLDRGVSVLQLITNRYPREAQAYYAIAVVRAVQGNTDDSLNALARAIELNAAFRDQAHGDARFNNLRAQPRFQQLVGADANPFKLN